MKDLSDSEIEENYWENLHRPSPLYGSDVKGSLFEGGEAGQWDLKQLDSCLKDGLGNIKLEGVNTPYLYFGSFGSMFAWHVEDYNMSAVNFHHYGKPKFWYGVSRKVRSCFLYTVLELVLTDFMFDWEN